MENNCFQQVATVIEQDSNKVKVLIERQSACASCHAKAACTSLDKKNQIISIQTEDARNYKEGERVRILITQSLGLKAVVLAFVVPAAILISAVAIQVKCFPMLDQSLAALVALLCYLVYYLLLYRFRARIDRHFVIKIRHLEQ